MAATSGYHPVSRPRRVRRLFGLDAQADFRGAASRSGEGRHLEDWATIELAKLIVARRHAGVVFHQSKGPHVRLRDVGEEVAIEKKTLKLSLRMALANKALARRLRDPRAANASAPRVQT